MATHRFQPTHYHITIGSHEPVLHMADGDTVITTTVDAGGYDASGEQVTEGGKPQTGPFYVEGAEPGDTLWSISTICIRTGTRASAPRWSHPMWSIRTPCA